MKQNDRIFRGAKRSGGATRRRDDLRPDSRAGATQEPRSGIKTPKKRQDSKNETVIGADIEERCRVYKGRHEQHYRRWYERGPRPAGAEGGP